MSEILRKYAGTKVLVTGGAGAIGSNLVKALLELGAKVAVLDDLSSGFMTNLPASSNLHFFRVDVTDSTGIARAVADVQPTIIFNLAAHYANLRSIQEPRRNLEVNVLAVLNLLECCSRSKVRRFVQASSSCVYDHAAPLPLSEESSVGPFTPYGISKRVAEEYCWFFRDYYNLDAVVVRYFNSYGPGDYPGLYRSVIPNMMAVAIRHRPLVITGTGDETRDFTFVTDIVTGTLLAGIVPAAGGEAFNIASGRETTINHLAEAINRISGNRAGVCFEPRRQWDLSQRRMASIEKAAKTLGYRPRVGLNEGLALTYQWLVKTEEQVEVNENTVY